MESVMLGDSGLIVSRIGLGLAALGRPGYINIGHAADLRDGRDVPAMAARAHAVLDAAYKAGVGDFDTARSYGRAEEFLAGWLAARRIAPQGRETRWMELFLRGGNAWERSGRPAGGAVSRVGGRR